MPITLTKKYEIKSSIQSGNYIELPFPYLRLSWNNGGDRAGKAMGHSSYFGGFQRGVNDVREDLAKLNMESLPSYFVGPDDWVSQDERTYQAYSSRYIYAAPILAKDDWYMDPKEINPLTGEPRKRHRLDFLCFLGSFTDKVLIPWGLAVVGEEGWNASNILKAFKAWQKDTAAARGSFAQGVPVEFFYHCVGSFGNDRVTEKAGERTVAVCQFNKPSEWTEELLTKHFVGEDTAEMIGVYQTAAADWFNDTKSSKQQAKGGKTKYSPEDAYAVPPEPEGPPDASYTPPPF